MLPKQEDQQAQPCVIKAGGRAVSLTPEVLFEQKEEGEEGRKGRWKVYFKVENGKEGIPGRGPGLCSGREE